MSHDEDDIAIASSDDAAHERIWDQQVSEDDEDEISAFLLSSDGIGTSFNDDIMLRQLSEKSADLKLRRRSSDHEKLWKSWQTSLNNSNKVEEIASEMKAFKNTYGDGQGFKRVKLSAAEQRESYIADSLPNAENVPQSVLKLLASDTLDTTKDWYFLTETPDYSIIPDPYATFIGCKNSVINSTTELYGKFGANNAKAFTEFTYCPYTKLIPVHLMCDLIEAHNTKTKDSFVYFIKFILDRQISVNIQTQWASSVWNQFSFGQVETYLKIVPRTLYLLHYRLTRLIPVQWPLVKELFPRDEDIVAEFEKLLDSQQWASLLYFILLILGTPALPFGNSKKMTYFKDCILDLNSQNSSILELSILKTYLRVCSKVS